MIPLDAEQQEALFEVTHDLMLVCCRVPIAEAQVIGLTLGTLYSSVLHATDLEAQQFADRAGQHILSPQHHTSH